MHHNILEDIISHFDFSSVSNNSYTTYPFNICVDSLNFPISELTSSVLRTSYALSACWTDIGTKSSNKSKKNGVKLI
jgi:hypothetical protein